MNVVCLWLLGQSCMTVNNGITFEFHMVRELLSRTVSSGKSFSLLRVATHCLSSIIIVSPFGSLQAITSITQQVFATLHTDVKHFPSLQSKSPLSKGGLWTVDPDYRRSLLAALRRSPYHPYHSYFSPPLSPRLEGSPTTCEVLILLNKVVPTCL